MSLRFEKKFWQGRKVLLTGHTGFKGAWLAAWLVRLGAKVHGFALPATGDYHLHGLLRTPLVGETLGDIRDPALVQTAIEDFEPEIVLHLAAQAIVRESYIHPIETFDVNVMGTTHLLNSIRTVPSVKSILIITTDKVYENLERGVPFSETDRLGGNDPYSTSKACAELICTSFRKSFFSENRSPTLASARAGNVIGGGDWAKDRLVPDIVRAMASLKPVFLRYPHSVRPWLHVLEPLFGYLLMAQRMTADPKFNVEALNFSPNQSETRAVADLVNAFSLANNGKPGWRQETGKHPEEAKLLTLSPARAKDVLGWQAQLSFSEIVNWTSDWYTAHAAGEDMSQVTKQQIDNYMSLQNTVTTKLDLKSRETGVT